MKWKKEYKSEKQAMKLMLDIKTHLSQKNIKKVKSTFQRGQFGFSSFFTSQPTIGFKFWDQNVGKIDHKGSISPTFYEQLFACRSQKRKKIMMT